MSIIFELKKKDVIIGYASYFLKYAGNILVLPFLVTSLSSEDFAIWNIFVAINAFVIVVDLGYGVVISRFVMYAYSGAKEIKNDTMPILEGKQEPNYSLLFQLMIASGKIYSRLSKYVLFILLIATIYVYYASKSKGDIEFTLVAWAIYSLSVLINIRILSEATVIKGVGWVGELQKITLINSLFSVLIKIILLFAGLKLVGLSIAFLITALMLAIQYYRLTRRLKINNVNEYKITKSEFEKAFVATF